MWPLQRTAGLLPLTILSGATRTGRGSAASRRWASLSAIHMGRRREDRAARQESAGSGPSGPPQRLSYAERRKAREEAKPKFRILKGKKDITHVDGPRPMSRQSRFYNPQETFGKNSIVYKARSGQLQKEIRALQDETPASRTPYPPPRERRARSGRPRAGDERSDRRGSDAPGTPRAGRGAAETSWDRFLASSEAESGGGDGAEDRPRPKRQDRGRGGSRRADADRMRPGRLAETGSAWPERRTKTEGTKTEGTWPERQAKKADHSRQPLSIPYTTAASEFLYGKSVVEAALRASRRQLYKLYIYGGANRQNVSQDLALQRLAERMGIETRIVGEEGQRLMDKMSAGRPHNGYVVEASPLPQPPLTGLGPVSEDGGKPGFNVNLSYQSAEDAKINGTTDFIECPRSDHRPLVVVLDQILDPGNLGAILRTVSFLGATAVAITRRNTASLTPVALKASAGASESLTLFSVESLPSFLAESKEHGWQVYAAAPATARSVRHRQLDVHEVEDRDPLSKDPCILLIGSEGEGLSRQLKSKADYEVNVPNLSGSDIVDSLNVSVATGLLCSAFLRGKVKSQAAALEDKMREASVLW